MGMADHEFVTDCTIGQPRLGPLDLNVDLCYWRQHFSFAFVLHIDSADFAPDFAQLQLYDFMIITIHESPIFYPSLLVYFHGD